MRGGVKHAVVTDAGVKNHRATSYGTMPETLTARRVVYEILHLGEANVTGNGSCGPYAVLGGVGLCEHVGDVGGGRTALAAGRRLAAR